MIIVGLTGGIASGKSTLLQFVKEQKIPTHDSDEFVNNLYKNPTKGFLSHLKKMDIKDVISNKRISKKIIKKNVFFNKEKLKELETYIHKQIKKSRNLFLKKNKKMDSKIVFLDMPLLFENKLEEICDYVILAYSPEKIRFRRATNRKNSNHKIIKRIISTQMPDKIKIKKSNYVIRTYFSKTKSYNQIIKAINEIMEKG